MKNKIKPVSDHLGSHIRAETKIPIFLISGINRLTFFG